jgi:hypothetical protein
MIVCVDCGSDAYLMRLPTEEQPYEVGDVIAYRCSGCNDRWDLVVEEDDFDEGPDEPSV